MILLDTNVVSEGLRRWPSPRVTSWLDARSAGSLFLCTPVLAELHFGVARLADGRRKNDLRAAIDRIENDLVRGRVLPLDNASAWQYGQLSAMRERTGRSIGQMDALIAAIALSNQAALATRNVADFADLGLELIDPFAPAE